METDEHKEKEEQSKVDIVEITGIDHIGSGIVNGQGKTIVMEIFVLTILDKDVEKLALVCCKPEFRESVKKALIDRLFPVSFEAIPGLMGMEPDPEEPQQTESKPVQTLGLLPPQEDATDLRTSEEWQKVCKVEVLDPDGWDRSDRSNYQHSWYEEKITREQFQGKLGSSTCQWPEGAFEKGFNIWTDIELVTEEPQNEKG